MILAMAGSADEREFRLGWSLFRRAHQAVAKRCHQASHFAREALRREGPPSPPTYSPTTPTSTAPVYEAIRLTDEQWQRVKPLLPTHPPPAGSAGCDHRTTLDGILWVLGNGASWRDLPREEFGPWETIYGRYRKWCRAGRWNQVVEALWPEDDTGSHPPEEVSL
jgi:hypothetical protein